jgi:hypothetical protein
MDAEAVFELSLQDFIFDHVEGDLLQATATSLVNAAIKVVKCAQQCCLMEI